MGPSDTTLTVDTYVGILEVDKSDDAVRLSTVADKASEYKCSQIVRTST